MPSERLRGIAFVALTGALALMILITLLVLGVPARIVFKPGFVIQSWIAKSGLHVPNRVGVLATGLLAWALLLGIRFAIVKSVSRLRRTRSSATLP